MTVASSSQEGHGHLLCLPKYKSLKMLLQKVRQYLLSKNNYIYNFFPYTCASYSLFAPTATPTVILHLFLHFKRLTSENTRPRTIFPLPSDCIQQMGASDGAERMACFFPDFSAPSAAWVPRDPSGPGGRMASCCQQL